MLLIPPPPPPHTHTHTCPGGGGGGGGGGHSGTEGGGGAPALHISRKKGSFFKTSACPRFCKRSVLFCTQVRSMGSKFPYNPWNIRGSDAEWLPKYLGFRVCCRHLLPLNRQRIIKSKVKNMCSRSSNVSVLIKEGVFIKWKKSAFLFKELCFFGQKSVL